MDACLAEVQVDIALAYSRGGLSDKVVKEAASGLKRCKRTAQPSFRRARCEEQLGAGGYSQGSVGV
jgi:hypothetical protein